jgi:hypothetical protein
MYGTLSIPTFENFLNATQNTFTKWSENTIAVNVKNTTCAMIFKFDNGNLKSTGLWSYQNKKFISTFDEDKKLAQDSAPLMEKVLKAMSFWIDKAQVEKKPERKPFKKIEKAPLSENQISFLQKIQSLSNASEIAKDEFTFKLSKSIIELINKYGSNAKISDKQLDITMSKFKKYGI